MLLQGRCGTMMINRKVYRLTLPTEDVAGFLNECERSEWYAFDTGERVMTEDGPDAEAVLLVEPVAIVEREVRAPLVH